MRHYYEEIDKYLKKFTKSIIVQSKSNFMINKIKFSPMQLLILIDIVEGNDNFYKLLDSFKLKRNILDTNIKFLIEKGIIKKQNCKEDKRQVSLILTDEGKSVVDGIDKIRSSFIKELMADFSVNEEKAILKFLVKLDLYKNK